MSSFLYDIIASYDDTKGITPPYTSQFLNRLMVDILELNDSTLSLSWKELGLSALNPRTAMGKGGRAFVPDEQHWGQGHIQQTEQKVPGAQLQNVSETDRGSLKEQDSAASYTTGQTSFTRSIQKNELDIIHQETPGESADRKQRNLDGVSNLSDEYKQRLARDNANVSSGTNRQTGFFASTQRDVSTENVKQSKAYAWSSQTTEKTGRRKQNTPSPLDQDHRLLLLKEQEALLIEELKALQAEKVALRSSVDAETAAMKNEGSIVSSDGFSEKGRPSHTHTRDVTTQDGADSMARQEIESVASLHQKDSQTEGKTLGETGVKDDLLKLFTVLTDQFSQDKDFLPLKDFISANKSLFVQHIEDKFRALAGASLSQGVMQETPIASSQGAARETHGQSQLIQSLSPYLPELLLPAVKDILAQGAVDIDDVQKQQLTDLLDKAQTPENDSETAKARHAGSGTAGQSVATRLESLIQKISEPGEGQNDRWGIGRLVQSLSRTSRINPSALASLVSAQIKLQRFLHEQNSQDNWQQSIATELEVLSKDQTISKGLRDEVREVVKKPLAPAVMQKQLSDTIADHIAKVAEPAARDEFSRMSAELAKLSDEQSAQLLRSVETMINGHQIDATLRHVSAQQRQALRNLLDRLDVPSDIQANLPHSFPKLLQVIDRHETAVSEDTEATSRLLQLIAGLPGPTPSDADLQTALIGLTTKRDSSNVLDEDAKEKSLEPEGEVSKKSVHERETPQQDATRIKVSSQFQDYLRRNNQEDAARQQIGGMTVARPSLEQVDQQRARAKLDGDEENQSALGHVKGSSVSGKNFDPVLRNSPTRESDQRYQQNTQGHYRSTAISPPHAQSVLARSSSHLSASSSEPSKVSVKIGRITYNAGTLEVPETLKARRPRPTMSLEEYNQRKRGRR